MAVWTNARIGPTQARRSPTNRARSGRRPPPPGSVRGRLDGFLDLLGEPRSRASDPPHRRERELVRREVGPGALSERRGVGLDVEQVVLDLKGEAEGAAVVSTFASTSSGAKARIAPDTSAARMSRPVFALVNREETLTRTALLALGLEVRDLASDHPAASDRVRTTAEHAHLGGSEAFSVRVAGEHGEAEGQQRVAREDRDRFAEDDVAGGRPAPQRSSSSIAGRSS